MIGKLVGVSLSWEGAISYVIETDEEDGVVVGVLLDHIQELLHRPDAEAD